MPARQILIIHTKELCPRVLHKILLIKTENFGSYFCRIENGEEGIKNTKLTP